MLCTKGTVSAVPYISARETPLGAEVRSVPQRTSRLVGGDQQSLLLRSPWHLLAIRSARFAGTIASARRDIEVYAYIGVAATESGRSIAIPIIEIHKSVRIHKGGTYILAVELDSRSCTVRCDGLDFVVLHHRRVNGVLHIDTGRGRVVDIVGGHLYAIVT